MFSITSHYNFISSSLAEQNIFNSDKREVVDYLGDIKTRIQCVDASILWPGQVNFSIQPRHGVASEETTQARALASEIFLLVIVCLLCLQIIYKTAWTTCL